MKMFFAYPNDPSSIGRNVENTAKSLKSESIECMPWPQMDIAGKFIDEKIRQKIEESDTVCADVTRLNFNVMFEIGYAIGKEKPILLTLDESLTPAKSDISHLGILDTIGYISYENSQGLARALLNVREKQALPLGNRSIPKKSPIYLIDTINQTDFSLRIKSKLKKAKTLFRSFDPRELPRLSTRDAIDNISQSACLVGQFLNQESTDAKYNNMRMSFVAGLAFALDVKCLLFQMGDRPVPLDYRELVTAIRYPEDVDKHVAKLAPRVIELVLLSDEAYKPPSLSDLQALDIGSAAAENEASRLAEYYLMTDEYQRTVNSNIRLVTGRKGSGKTALFYRVRDVNRSNRGRIVIDLKPDGYQLKRFKSLVLNHVSEEVQEHLSTAFWEYVLYLEIAYKLLEKDRQRYMSDHTIYKEFINLEEEYAGGHVEGDIDFSERMLQLISRISGEFNPTSSTQDKNVLTEKQVNELIYKHDIPKLRDALLSYLVVPEKPSASLYFKRFRCG